MAVAVADIVLIRKQVLEALILMPVAARYTDALGSNSSMGVLQELTDKILIVDEAVCTDICMTPGHPYANKFMTLSAAFSSGDKVTEHIGIYGDVLVAPTNDIATLGPSIAAKSREEILRMIDNATLYGGTSRNHFIEQNFIYHSGYQAAPSAKVYYPQFTKTAACQAPDNYTDVLIYGTIDLCEKLNSEDPFFDKNTKLYQLSRGLVRSGAEFIPSQQQLSAMLAKAA
jgi:hypothetical protein